MRSFFLSVVVSSWIITCGTIVVLSHKYHTAFQLGPDTRQGDILRHQKRKILEDSQPFETIILGDSTAGTGIDSEYMTKLSGRRILNLALTGSFGLGGALALLQRVPDRMGVRNVILVFSVDAMGSRVAHDGFVLAGGFPTAVRLPPEDIVGLARRYLVRYTDGSAALDHILTGFRKLPPAVELRTYDYPLSFQRIDRENIDYLPPKSVARTARAYLAQISKLCRERGFRCVYVHGATLEEIIEPAKPFIDSANRHIEEVGISLASGVPIGFSFSQRGDTVFHIHPTERSWLTRRYFELIERAICPGCIGG